VEVRDQHHPWRLFFLWYPFDGRMRKSGLCEVEKNILTLLGIESRLSSPLLYRLRYYGRASGVNNGTYFAKFRDLTAVARMGT
jgi:hypothetical protein